MSRRTASFALLAGRNIHPCNASTPISGIDTFFKVNMKTGVRPVHYIANQAVFDRIPMDIVNVSLIIDIITDHMAIVGHRGLFNIDVSGLRERCGSPTHRILRPYRSHNLTLFVRLPSREPRFRRTPDKNAKMLT